MVIAQQPKRWAALPFFAAALVVVAVVGSLSALDAGGEYLSLERPSWAPPQWLFGPAWTVLYVMIALSGWLAWSARGWTPGMGVYALQLVLNAAWTPLFFGAGQYGLAFAEIIVLWLSIVATIVMFRRISRPAAWLLVPYLLWVTYAASLNFAIWQLN
ncbi:tryptophan-rich sensory protein [Streptosporangium becharense]|uniref:Tryptophan-rich sensory protein n=1 Tax=Streptosporangium becharense TaxID=1816182 RepID=A0A7W9MG02_9ACTN|nr:TspO/MBR family protein [Streptosporangium becharense]MBB2910106.1 tryptophan-rich sensory protein [Streptosporangium becharense]MBB5818939.1 tryptophan-rich sensory protein [Streptosporangium becharense]